MDRSGVPSARDRTGPEDNAIATIVLGAVGAVAGFYTGGPGGALKGFQIGVAVGSLVDQMTQPGQHQEVGRLTDLRVSGSSYGAFLTQSWGATRKPGNIIWSTSLVQHSNTQSQGGGSGGGGASTTTYSYTVSCAVSLGRQSGIAPNRHHRVTRIWANDTIVYDAASSTNPVTPRFYDGSQSAADTLILADKGASPAYTGQAYAVFQDFDLTNYGNQIPNFSFETATDPVTVGDIVSDVAAQVGLSAADLDVSAATDAVTGFMIDSRQGGADALRSLLAAYLYDLTEVDGVLRLVKRGGAPAGTVSVLDLGAAIVAGGSSGGPSSRLTEKRKQESELPSRVDMTYYSVAANFQQVTQSAVKFTARVFNAVSLSVPLTLTDVAARQMSERQLYTAWIERETFSLSVPFSYILYAPADVLLLPVGSAGTLKRVRITEYQIGLPGQVILSCTLDDSAIVTQGTLASQPGTAIAAPQAIVPTTFTAWSLPAPLRPADAGVPGFYVAGCGPAGWRGGAVYYSLDGGGTWLPGGALPGPSVIGATTSALANAPAGSGFDNVSTVGISLVSGGQVASTSDAVLTGSGANAALVGKEVLQFGTAALTGPGAYTLSHLRRGQLGSATLGHAAGEAFVALAASGIAHVTVGAASVGQTVQVKVVSPYQMLTDVAAQTITIAAPALTQEQQDVLGLQNQINALAAPLTGTAISPPPYWQMKYLFNQLSRVPVAADFSGAPMTPYFANGGDGSLRYETPGLALNAYWQMKLKNTGAAAVTVNWSVPAVDNFASAAWNGASLFSSSGATSPVSGTFSIAAGATGLLELFYANTNNGVYNTANQGTLWFFMDALLKAGVQFVDAATGLPPPGTVQQTDINNWNGKENSLGNPAANGYVLSSTAAGMRSWVVSGTYTLPAATVSVLGGVKIGANVSVAADGTISVAAPPTSLPPSGTAGGDLTGTYPNPALTGIITAGSGGDATHTVAITYDAKGRITALVPTAIAFPVTGVAGRTGAVTLAYADISGLGTAATANVPASGNASAGQVVLGSDTRLGATSSTNVFISPISGYQALLLIGPGYQLPPGSASFVSAPLLTDKTTGDATTGYKGTTFAAGKPSTIVYQSGNSLASGVVAAWPVSESSGTTVRDISGNNLSLSFQGTSPTWGTGPNGTILTFGGAGSVTAPDNALFKPTTGFTFSGYANFSTSQVSGSARIFRKTSTAGAYFGVAGSSGVYETTTGTAYNSNFPTTAYEGAYHLYTITVGAGTLTYYVDGTSIGTTTGSGTLTWDTDPLYLMGKPGGSDYAVGSLDVAYEWSRALSAAEVAGLASNPYQLIGVSSGGTSITALLDTGTLGSLPISTIKVTRTWSQQLAEVLEYSSNGTTWTAIPTGYTPVSNGGAAASLQTTVTLGTPINARYLRYSGKDSGSGAQILLTDISVS